MIVIQESEQLTKLIYLKPPTPLKINIQKVCLHQIVRSDDCIDPIVTSKQISLLMTCRYWCGE